jgi:beta-galactosidase
VVFAEVVGRAQAWVDGIKRAEKTDFAGAPLVVPFPAGVGERQVVLVVEAEPGKASGLGRTISVRER